MHSLSHITLPVGDLDVAERFYVGLLGFEVERRVDREAFLRFRPDRASELDAVNSPLHLALKIEGGVSLDLFLQKGLERTRPRPHPHFAFAVSPKSLEEHRGSLVAANVNVDGPRRLGPPGQASLYFTDPWGNHLELVAMGFPGDLPIGPPDLSRL